MNDVNKMMTIKINGKKIFAPLENKALALTPEERVRQEYICRLVNVYGFALEQMRQELQVANSHRRQGKAKADIVVWKSAKDKNMQDSPVIVVECKPDHIAIQEEDYFRGHNYASCVGADFFVTTNLKETRIFRVIKGEMPTRLEEIVDIPKAEDLNNPKKLKELLQQTKNFTRDEFSKVLFKCHNIIRNNDKLSPEAAFDEISKILFIKIRYERENFEGQIFSEERFKENRKTYETLNKEIGGMDVVPFYQNLFERTKQEFAKDELFEVNDMLKIKEASFEAIVKELQIYNLSRTTDDVKGIAFEKFLGKTFRGELGQFFTPRTIVDFMVELLDPQEGEIICDPCCGSGGFLIKSFEYVREKIEKDILKVKETIKNSAFDTQYQTATDKQKNVVDQRVNHYFAILNKELDTREDNSRLRELSHGCIFGTDANPRMARTAKMNMIMHGDGHGGVHHHDGLLNVNGVFENRFDVILTNPPFGSRVEKSLKITEADKFADQEMIDYYTERYGEEYKKALTQVDNHIGKSVLSLYQSGKFSGLTEVLFVERCINLLKPGGRLGVVLPEGVLNNTNLQSVRELFESMVKIILITSIPQDVFMASGATVKPSLMFFKKFTDDERLQYTTAVAAAREKIEKKYSYKTERLNDFIANRENSKADIRAKKVELKGIKTQIEREIRSIVREFFSYQIPVTQVDKAGITATGAECENELNELLEEYTLYRKSNEPWESVSQQYEYRVEGDRVYRKKGQQEWKELC